MADYDEYQVSEQYTLFPCPHPDCVESPRWYKRLEQHYSCAHEGEECSTVDAKKERWRRRGERMRQKVILSNCDVVSKLLLILMKSCKYVY